MFLECRPGCIVTIDKRLSYLEEEVLAYLNTEIFLEILFRTFSPEGTHACGTKQNKHLLI